MRRWHSASKRRDERSRALIRRGDSIRASPRACENMIGALDARLVAQRGAEQRQLLAAQALAGRRGSANRTMVLRQQDRAVGHLRALGHVALIAANFGQRLRTLCDRRSGGTQPRAIGVELAART